jgi:4-amino-4-deoxy-L-arabinose transferase-like glycosyltransferase
LIKKGKSSKKIKSTRGSGLKELVDHRALRAVVLVAVLLLAAYTAFFRLGVEEWDIDEPIYRNAGLEYVQDSNYTNNREHPFLVKFILGITQVVFGSSEAGVVRIPAATAFLLTGLVLFVFARRVAGYWVGVLALALWTISPLTLAFGRVATLEVFLAFFSTLALYLGWRWAESGSWWFAGFCGVAVGLATASKVIGILFLPAILLVGLLKIGLSRRLIFQSVLLGLAAAAAALAAYAPLGTEAPSAIQYMLDKQSRHNARGHAVTINDVSYKYPPWWAYLWWQWKLYGTLASFSLGATVIFAVLRRRALEIYLLVAALVPFLVLSFYAQVKLSHYIDAWQPPLILLVALVVGKLARHRIVGGIVAVLLLAPFVYLGVHAVQAVSQVQPGPKAAVAEYLKGTGHDKGPVLVWGSGGLIKEYLPEAQVLKKPDDAQGEAIEAVIVDRSAAKRKPNRAIESYLATNRDRFESSNPADKFEVYTRKSQQPTEDGE